MNVCTCPEPEMLHDYLRGALTAADDTAIDEHLEACLSCQSALDALDARDNAVFGCLRDTPAEPVIGGDAPPRALVARAVALGNATEPAATELGELPAAFGNYTLLQLIGAGGMGYVYKAEHQRMKRTVALKVLAPQLLRSSSARARFLREVEAASRLSSPYIVTALDAGECQGRDYLAMEYVAGQTLADRVRESGPLRLELAMSCTIQAARGLQHAHDAGIVHRDVKPSNILLEPPVAGRPAQVKILDLGLARLRQGSEANDLTGADAPMGTTHFMAPEQAVNPRAVDNRADVYSLGCTLFYLLTGRPPYDGDNAMQVLLAHRDGAVPSLGATRADVSQALDALFQRMVAKAPEDRPCSMRNVIAELLIAARLPDKQLPPRRRKPHGRPAVAVFAASVLFAAFLGALLGSGNIDDDAKESPPPVAAAKPPIQPAPPAAPVAMKSPALDLVPIRAGQFFMGASDGDKNAQANEKPRKRVTIKAPFLMGKTEVTQAQYEEVMGKNPSAFAASGKYAKFVGGKDTSQLPVESVSWLDAIRFCIRLSERHGLAPFYKVDGERVTSVGGAGYRLPTEAEWEYACRGGTDSMWSFGEKAAHLGDHAWFAANSADVTHPVGTKKANPFGLLDMYGNVPEWCWDRYDDRFYNYAPTSDPVSRTTSPFHTFRGGGWNMDAAQLRTTWRRPLGIAYGSGPGNFHYIGFRVVRNSE